MIHDPSPRSASIQGFALRPALAFVVLFLACFAIVGCGASKESAGWKSDARQFAKGGMFQPKDNADGEKPIEPQFNTEDYHRIIDNAFVKVSQDPLSTLSIDVDTASYSNVRRFLNEGRLPPKDAVRIEEMINYFQYDYPQPIGEHPVTITTEVASCPWNSAHILVRVGVQGKKIAREELPPRNLVFLVDTSGSMMPANRLPLLKKSLELLVEQLTAKDRVSLVAYAGSAGLVLPSTPGDRKSTILRAIRQLDAGGSTNGGEGIVLAYQIAQESFINNGINRVILGTDGDFNVGVSSEGELLRLIEEKRRTGVFLTILGFGIGNLKDSRLEQLADHGNGHYAYIDCEREARKVFVEEGAALVTIAKDVKIQVEFNPQQVAGYRLIGYENRLLRHQDFNNDQKGAGAMGAGHCVTALYEIVPAGMKVDAHDIDPLKYQDAAKVSAAAAKGELLTVKLRYKDPTAETSKLLSVALAPSKRIFEQASGDFRFAASVASFGMALRDSPHKGQMNLSDIAGIASNSLGQDVHGHRAEFLQLVSKAQGLLGHR